MMAWMSPFLWLAGLTGFLTWTVAAASSARIAEGPASRWSAVASCLSAAALAAGAALALAAGPSAGGPVAAASPARARLFLDGIEAPIASHLAVGWSPDAGVELGEEHDLVEARRGWNLVDLVASGGRLTLAPAAVPRAGGAPGKAAGSATGLVLAARPGSAPAASDAPGDDVDQDGGPAPTDQLATWARHLAQGCATAGRSPAPVTLDGPGQLMMVACAHGRPALALAVSRSGAGRLWLVPLRASGRDFARYQIAIGKGALLQIGSPAEAAPGIEVWQVPTPAGGTRLLLPPSDPLASCRRWSRALAGAAPGQAGDPAGTRAGAAAGAGAGGDRGGDGGSASAGDDDRIVCVLPFTAPFALQVRRLVPDLAGVTGRALWAGGLLILPALLWLAWLAARRRTHLTRSALASALGFTFVSLVLCGLAAWRLLWAHRIDMLREVEPLGWRTLENQALVALIAAALAATAMDRARPDLPAVRRAALALAAWLAIRLLGLVVLAGAAPPAPWRPTAAALVSLALGLGPALVALIRDAGRRARLRPPGPLAALLLAGAAAGLIAAAAPRQPGLKLACAWLVVVSFYSALRVALPGRAARLLTTVAAGAGAALACLALDPGITAALVAPGLVLALLLAAHDASFDDAALTEVGTFRLRHAPLIACHAALVLVVAAGVLGWAAAGLWGPTDPDLGRTLTALFTDLPLLVAGFLAPAAWLLARRRGRLPPEQSKGGKPPAAWPWALAAALALALWLVRAPLTDLVLASHSQAAHRIAQVTAPGYALLRSPDHFLAGLTAWRETALPAAAHPWTGQGLFGARLFDPGVLLSVDNDYLAVLILRETGLAGILASAVLLTTTAAGLWLLAGERFRRGSAAQRRRTLVALILGALALYQPLGALGALPLTGLPWPGLGIDSPSDLWILVALLLAVVVWGPTASGELESWDTELRRQRRFIRLRRTERALAALVCLTSLALLARAALFAAHRPPAKGRVASALRYARGLRCPGPGADLVGHPTDDATRRAGRELAARWRRARTRIAPLLARSDPAALSDCDALDPPAPWQAGDGDAPGQCLLRADLGLPEVEITIGAAAGPADQPRVAGTLAGSSSTALPAHRGSASANPDPDAGPGHPTARSCRVVVPETTLRRLRLPTARPPERQRVRLVARAMGAASHDVGELVSGGLIIRLRPGAPPLDLASTGAGRAGLHAAGRVTIGAGATLVADRSGPTLELGAGAGRVLLLSRAPHAPASGADADSDASVAADSWLRQRAAPGSTTALDHLALLVIGGAAQPGRGVWLFRPTARWPGDTGPAVVDALLADDVLTVGAAPRRAYPYGDLVPEVGWVNRYRHRHSLGLDGWVRAALDQLAATAATATAAATAGPGAPSTPAPAAAPAPACGTLDPPAASPAQVCARAADGAIECRVSLQPELDLRLRALTQLIALDPDRYAGPGRDLPSRGGRFRRPVRATYALLRGDTGEILAQGEFVAGRQASLYAPATAAIERELIRAREHRDLTSGRPLPPSRGRASGEKIEWNAPIAVGSAMKPLMARAFQQTAPGLAGALFLDGVPTAGAACRGGRSHAIFGHCPPTDSLWNHQQFLGLSDFLAVSANWYMAALGLFGTALPDGQAGLGPGALPLPLSDILAVSVGDHPTSAALWTQTAAGATVLSSHHTIDLAALRTTPLWRNFEALVGRPLCTDGDKQQCRQAGDRADLCAARALPVADPGPDLRSLVALGPDRFDFYPAGARRRRGSRVPSLEYLQFLRGSGVHPIGSLLQLTDGFNRLIYDPLPGSAGYRLAASWFPVPAAGAAPAADCSALPASGDPVRDGLCEVVRRGTASRALGDLLTDPSLLVYGAKTGTIDSLGDVATHPAACRRFNDAHTLTDRPRTAAHQPYWLPCGPGAAHAAGVNDSLFLISFGVPGPRGQVVPLTLGLHFQKSGAGLAADVAGLYLTAIRDYFAPPARRPM